MGAVSFGVRVGSAAFALGLGLAVAAGHGVAAADDPDSSSPNASSSPTGAPSIAGVPSTGPRASGSPARAASRNAPSAGKVRAPAGSNRTAGDVDSGDADPGHLEVARKSPVDRDAPKGLVAGGQFGDAPDSANLRTAEDDSPDPVGVPRPVAQSGSVSPGQESSDRESSDRESSDQASSDQAAETSAAATARPAGIVSGVLSLLGFGPPENGTGTPPTPMELVTAALSLVSRDIARISARTGIT
ncbi:MAG: hypothetical protein U0R81_11975, partial [Mycobacterium sp.]